MGISAIKSLLVFGQRPPLGNASENPDAGPSAFFSGTGLYDPRVGYNVTSLGFIAWYGSGSIPTVDQVPSAISAVNIAAAQAPTAATALTLVSSTGAGITVLASALLVYGSGNTIAVGALAIDGPPGLVGTGTPVVATGNSRARWYDPTKSVARCLRYTSVGNDSAGSITTVGADLYGYPQTETVTLANAGVATGKKAFKFITSITPNGTLSGSNISVGTSDTYGLPIAASSAAYVDAFWGSPGSELGLGGTVAGQSTIILPLQLSDIATGTFKMALPFDGTITSVLFRTAKPASTAAKLATLTAEINGTNVTGGVMNLTTANQNTIGGSVAGSAITGANTFTAGQTIGVTASAVTAFVEGDGWVEFTVENNDLGGGTFTVPDTTSPATASTGDVRGTIALPSASDGTKRLQLFIAPSLAEVSNASGPVVGLFGVTPA